MTEETIKRDNERIAITLAAGRPRVVKVLEKFLENAEKYNYNLKNFSVYISVDNDFMNVPFEEFRIPERISHKLGHIELISKERRIEIGKRIEQEYGLPNKLASTMFYEKGYSPLRNCALYRAMEDGNDIAVFFDDDELPIVPVKDEEGNISWHNLDFFTPHIHAIRNGAEITRGPYMGYLSPIPSDFDKDIPVEIRKALGNALSHGSDVIDANTFMELMNKHLKFLSYEKINSSTSSFEVKEDKYGKHIYAGNMAFDLKAVREGKIPLFYTPPQARGEDTIFALQLKNVRVKEVNAYIFHDPFNMYPELLEGKTPAKLEPIPVTEESVNRFVSALIGWLKYAPILVKMTSVTKEEERKRIEKMILEIQEPAQQLSQVLNNPKIKGCKDILEEYRDSLEDNFFTLQEVQKAWKTKILPNKRLVVIE